ncbi:MAG: N-ethylammeline chlorohydrolase, partial [Deltaproteobacteria bacterium]|nr:N-ethylammeline chlorohydrolase [Deltaproteobacteria bacterium]
MRLLIQNALLITLNDDHEIIENGGLVIEGDRLTYVGAGDRAPSGPFERVIDGRRLIALPGFVNSHCHSPSNLFRGLFKSRP